MLILNQNGKTLINFDNVKEVKLNDSYSDKELSIIAYFTDGTAETIATYRGNDMSKGKLLIDKLSRDYKGNGTIKLDE